MSSSIIPVNFVRSECTADGNVTNAKNPQPQDDDSDVSEILEMDSRTLLENLKNIERQGNLDDCRQAISQTAKWLEKHSDASFVRRQYLILARDRGLPEQQQAAITQMAIWLRENSGKCDSYVLREYLKLTEEQGTVEQCKEAIEQTFIWLPKHLNELYVRTQYLLLARKRGTEQHCQEVIEETTSWLKEHLSNCDSYVLMEYLRLVREQGTSQHKQEAIAQAESWLKENPDNSYVRSQYLALMRSQG